MTRITSSTFSSPDFNSTENPLCLQNQYLEEEPAVDYPYVSFPGVGLMLELNASFQFAVVIHTDMCRKMLILVSDKNESNGLFVADVLSHNINVMLTDAR